MAGQRPYLDLISSLNHKFPSFSNVPQGQTMTTRREGEVLKLHEIAVSASIHRATMGKMRRRGPWSTLLMLCVTLPGKPGA
jgi:hypothetical protein